MPPKLVYGDECHYCTWAATFAVGRSDIVLVPLSAVGAGHSRLIDGDRERLPADYESRAQLVTDDAVYSCGAATEQALVIAGVLPAGPIAFLRQCGPYVGVRETLYHFVSNHRDLWSKVLHREPPIRSR